MEQLALPATTVTTAPAPALQQAYEAPSYPPETEMMPPFSEQRHSQQLQAFWVNQMTEIKQLDKIKYHSLPLARIKKIMKADEDVKMIAGEVTAVFSQACEMFILEMTMRAWNNTALNKRRTLQKCDVSAAIAQTDIFDFLVDIVPRNDDIKEVLTEPTVPYCFFPPQDQEAPAVTAMMTLMEESMDHYAWGQQPTIQQKSEMELGSDSKSDG